MKRASILVLVVIALMWVPAWATDLSMPSLLVVQINGQLNATDGCTRYTLNADGRFSSFPLADSGYSIQGRWKLDNFSKDLKIKVEGLWTRVNQVSRRDDGRTMKLVIHAGTLRDTGHPEADLYQSTFVIEEMKFGVQSPSPLLKDFPALPLQKMTVNGIGAGSP